MLERIIQIHELTTEFDGTENGDCTLISDETQDIVKFTTIVRGFSRQISCFTGERTCVVNSIISRGSEATTLMNKS